MSTARLKEMRFKLDVEDKKVETVRVADKPITQNGDAKVIEMPVATFAKSVGMKRWLETSFMVDIEFKASTENAYGYTEFTKEQFTVLKKSANALKDRLVICKMGDAGYGVFTDTEIPFNACIGIYTGYFRYATPAELDAVDNERYASAFYSVNPEKTSSWINAKDYGNITRFLQHLPDETPNETKNTALSHYRFSTPDLAKNVATANVEQRACFYKGYPIIALMTTKKIPAYGQPGFSYGDQYLRETGMIPSLFNKQGETIPPAFYTLNPRVDVLFTSKESKKNQTATIRSRSLLEIQEFAKSGVILSIGDEEIIFPPNLIRDALEKAKNPLYLKINLRDKPPAKVTESTGTSSSSTTTATTENTEAEQTDEVTRTASMRK